MADLFAHLPAAKAPAPGRHGAPLDPPGVTIATRDAAVVTVIARPGRVEAAIAGLAAHFGAAPRDAAVLTRAGAVDFVGIAPGRWTVLSAEPSEALVAALEGALGESGHVVDQSGGQVVLALDGPAVPDLLTKLVAIDLDPVAAPLDAAPTTVLSHVGATLVPGETASSRRLIVGRSYLAAALRLLVASAAETGCELRA